MSYLQSMLLNLLNYILLYFDLVTIWFVNVNNKIIIEFAFCEISKIIKISLATLFNVRFSADKAILDKSCCFSTEIFEYGILCTKVFSHA